MNAPHNFVMDDFKRGEGFNYRRDEIVQQLLISYVRLIALSDLLALKINKEELPPSKETLLSVASLLWNNPVILLNSFSISHI